jgi:RNA polymerase sigma-70 factor (ECF subfamily)
MQFSHSQTLHLLDRALSGDRAAMGELLERHSGRVLRIVRARLGQQLRQYMESQDILQEAMLQALQSIDQLQTTDEATLLQWLSSIVENTLRSRADYHGAQKRTSTFVPLEPGTFVATTKLSESAAQETISREQQELVDQELSKLPKDLREVFVLRHFMGVSFSRIAEGIEGASAEQVRKMYRRARHRLVIALDGKI